MYIFSVVRILSTEPYENASIFPLRIFHCRDEAQAKMLFLKDKADKDLLQHNSEMKELVRIIDHDRNQREFMNTKGKELQEDAQSVAWRQKKGWLSIVY